MVAWCVGRGELLALKVFQRGSLEWFPIVGDWLWHWCVAVDCMLGSQPSRGWRLCFPLWLHAGGSGFGLCGGSGLGTYLLIRWGPGALAVCRARRGLPVGLLLLPCSVLFAVKSLPLLCLFVIS